ncbi:MAG: PilZ domain-containing protein [Thermodesulfobacteriota bacterium]
MGSTLERRREQRHSCFLDVKTINGRPVSETYLVDITRNGAQIAGNFLVVIGDEISIGLPMMNDPGGQAQLEDVTARIVWVQKTYANPEELMRYRFGVSFLFPFKGMEYLLQIFRWRDS